MRKFFKILIKIFFFMIIIHLFLNNFIIYNKTDSLKKGIYFVIPVNKESIKEGDIVLFDMPKDLDELVHKRKYIDNTCHTFLKKVGAISGSKIENKNNILYINNKKIAKIFLKDMQNNDLPQIKSFIISEKGFFPIGTHEKSFDGRYYGEVNKNLIRKKAFYLFPL